MNMLEPILETPEEDVSPPRTSPSYKLDIVPVPGDGDCLFHSVSYMVHHKWSPTLLRSLVSRTIARGGPAVHRLIQTWTELHQADPRAPEFAFMARLGPQPTPTEVAERIMDKHLFWGESVSLRLMEEYFHVRFLLLHDQDRLSLNWHHSPGYTPVHYALLYLSHEHYQPVRLTHQGCSKYFWNWDELPLDIQKAFTETGRK